MYTTFDTLPTTNFAADFNFLCNPYAMADDLLLCELPDAPLFQNPYLTDDLYDSMMDLRFALPPLPEIQPIDMSMMPAMGPKPGYLFSNPFECEVSPEIEAMAYDFMCQMDPSYARTHSHPFAPSSGSSSMDFSFDHEDKSPARMKLDESERLEHERDTAVDNYHRAMDSGNYDEALKWETQANSRENDLYDLWGTPRYCGNPRAKGL